MKLNIHYFQHVPFEGLAIIEDWILEKGHNITSTQFYEDIVYPDPDAIDWLIIMGGPMSVYEEETYPWMKAEKAFIADVIKKNKVVLGICLGSQFIAEVLGAKVYPNTQQEIGWFPINITKEAQLDPLFGFLPASFPVFHWHGDTYDLPEDAMLVAGSVVTKNQAFKYSDRVVGLQFHFEVGDQAIREMVDGADAELVKGEYVQTATEILASIEYAAPNVVFIKKILDALELVNSKI